MSNQPAPPAERSLRTQGLRFLLGGGANTILSYCIYWLLLQWLPYGVAFTASYALTMFSGFAINTYFVFGSRWSWHRFAAFPLVHLVNYLAGLAVITAWVRLMGFSEQLAPVAATVVTLPLNFTLTRLLIRPKA
ncbi:GtrA family protein [Pseudoxanthomonas sp. CF125]|jgi:putative flippase GtrA|uniref:GtrA family protein n=1 Tax=Pseudoxanthomonas sp. CF125 TaxID=1855303 RepID=UPI00088C082C|nr:GtrA family protein [Pseudoxanthomonas sp. CF125]SDQ88794.1 Putative flippase GtrA (transmembrane translocase of bactoprenol-linked glucose) [Pseudoxanthomonas sp. CF125]